MQVFKNFPISAAAFVMASVVDREVILVYCVKKMTVSADRSALSFGV